MFAEMCYSAYVSSSSFFAQTSTPTSHKCVSLSQVFSIIIELSSVGGWGMARSFASVSCSAGGSGGCDVALLLFATGT